MTQLASRAQELTQLISNGDQATGAIASQSHNLETALSLLPGALNHTTSTYAGLRATLDALDPLVKKSKPASRRLEPFAAGAACSRQRPRSRRSSDSSAS